MQAQETHPERQQSDAVILAAGATRFLQFQKVSKSSVMRGRETSVRWKGQSAGRSTGTPVLPGAVTPQCVVGPTHKPSCANSPCEPRPSLLGVQSPLVADVVQTGSPCLKHGGALTVCAEPCGGSRLCPARGTRTLEIQKTQSSGGSPVRPMITVLDPWSWPH